MFKKVFCIVFIFFGFTVYGGAIEVPVDWQYFKNINIENIGLVSVKIPFETINVSRENLEDIRIYDAVGGEVPYSISIPARIEETEQPLRDYKVTVNENSTELISKTGISEQIDSIAIITPASGFLKSVSVFSSSDQNEWNCIAKDKPIFRQSYNVENIHIEFTKGSYKYLKVILNDKRKDAIPITGLSVRTVSQESVYPDDEIKIDAIERSETPSQSRIVIKLPAKNLRLSKIMINTDNSLFTRQVSVLTREYLQGEIKESYIEQGTIYRVSVDGQNSFEKISILVSAQIKNNEIILVINNGNSPPLSIKKVTVFVKPVFIRFLTKTTGTFYVLTGNQLISAPKYDISELNEYLQKAKYTSVKIGQIVLNPKYKPPETLPELSELGTSIDVSDWQFRKIMNIPESGIQKLELDFDVIVHADTSMKDLRLVRDGKQIPFIIERTSILRSLQPNVTNIPNDKKLPISSWLLTLPKNSIPVTYLSCNVNESIFQRNISLYEEILDERGAKSNRYLGNAIWTRIPNQSNTSFSINLNTKPITNKIILVIQNGDNPPLTISNIQFYYLITRLLFKATANNNTYLYYGNKDVSSPQYDIDLVANEVLSADKKIATLNKEEALNPSTWWELPVLSGAMRIVFWIVMIIVVIGLLVVIIKLLPKNS
ncbi:MAG: DUF3999 family protein [Elusimicrobia bacterium]|nr:DUF3999 family protein [Elusimicrobiota bacterium]